MDPFEAAEAAAERVRDLLFADYRSLVVKLLDALQGEEDHYARKLDNEKGRNLLADALVGDWLTDGEKVALTEAMEA
jgi:hypothetical protein